MTISTINGLRSQVHRSALDVSRYAPLPDIQEAGRACHTLTSRRSRKADKAMAALTLAVLLAR